MVPPSVVPAVQDAAAVTEPGAVGVGVGADVGVGVGMMIGPPGATTSSAPQAASPNKLQPSMSERVR